MTRAVMIPIVAGLLLAASTPPGNHWFLAPLGLALLYRCTDQALWTKRFFRGWLTTWVMFLFTFSWTRQFHDLGWVALSAAEAVLFGTACAIVPTRRLMAPGLGIIVRGPGQSVLSRAGGRAAAFCAALTLGEFARRHWPFGGIPLGGFTTGQTHGPLASAVCVVGELGLVAILAAVGVGVSEVFRLHPKRWLVGWTAIAITAGLAIVGAHVSVQHQTTLQLHTTLRVAGIQGGGPQALTRSQQQPGRVFANQYRATQLLTSPVDLIVWPENAIALNLPIQDSLANPAMAELARSHHATVIAGVTELVNGRRFHNAAIAWAPDGAISGRYEKRHPVPFGEYVPGRKWLSHVAGLGQVPYDAYVGSGPPVLDVKDRRVGVMLSYDALFAGQSRTAVRDGAGLLLIPTNSASYRSPHVADMQLEAARFRALETRRWVIQVAPTGISAIIDDRGHVQTRSTIGTQTVVQRTVPTNAGETPYVRWGDTPAVLLAGVTLLLRWHRVSVN